MPASPPAERGTTPAVPRTAVRVWATAEVVLILRTIFLMIWVVEPMDRPGLVLAVRIMACCCSHRPGFITIRSTTRTAARQFQSMAGVLPISLVAEVGVGAGFF
jgi:hypothetical protein